MKIAFVVHDYRRMEGHSRYVVELATRFAREHEVHVFANQIDTEGNTAIRFHHVPAWRPSALASILSFAVSATWKVRGRFDIIHNQGLCGVRGNVFTAHICNAAWHRALRQAFGRVTVREWVSGNTLRLLEGTFYRFARSARVIAVSRRIAADLRDCYQCGAPIDVVYHGVDLHSFTPARENPARAAVREACGLRADEMAFLFVGDMRKGGAQCVRALSRMTGGKLMFVSRTPDGPYRALAAELGLSERVLFLGTTSEVQKYYAAADALLLPTHYDSFAMVVTEAMASALPVIVSREAGASELIVHGKNGLILQDYRDEAELSKDMCLLMDDRALAHALGAAARRTVERYSWDEAASQTMQIYQQACGLGSRASRGRQNSSNPTQAASAIPSPGQR